MLNNSWELLGEQSDFIPIGTRSSTDSTALYENEKSNE
jgi:hypothetical protein